jgi:hypothetical protein
VSVIFASLLRCRSDWDILLLMLDRSTTYRSSASGAAKRTRSIRVSAHALGRYWSNHLLTFSLRRSLVLGLRF